MAPLALHPLLLFVSTTLLSSVSDSKRIKSWFAFLSYFGETLKSVFCWHFPLPPLTSPPKIPAPRPLLSSQLPGCSRACSGRRGLFLAQIQLEAEEEKPAGKETFHPSLRTETTFCFPSVPAKNLVTLSKPAESIHPGTWRV